MIAQLTVQIAEFQTHQSDAAFANINREKKYFPQLILVLGECGCMALHEPTETN